MSQAVIEHDWRSPGAERRGRTTHVTHMDLAIYLHMLHITKQAELSLIAVWRLGRGQHEFVFDDPRDVVSKLALEFVNCPITVGLMTAQRNLKTIMREQARERPTRR